MPYLDTFPSQRFEIYGDNIQSQRLLKKMGFDQASQLKDNLMYFTLRAAMD